jgi:hypothetical protein
MTGLETKNYLPVDVLNLEKLDLVKVSKRGKPKIAVALLESSIF